MAELQTQLFTRWLVLPLLLLTLLVITRESTVTGGSGADGATSTSRLALGLRRGPKRQPRPSSQIEAGGSQHGGLHGGGDGASHGDAGSTGNIKLPPRRVGAERKRAEAACSIVPGSRSGSVTMLVVGGGSTPAFTVATGRQADPDAELDPAVRFYCQCAQQHVAVAGPGSLNDFSYGPWPIQSGWSLFPASCINACSCGGGGGGGGPPVVQHAAHAPLAPSAAGAPNGTLPTAAEVVPLVSELPGIDSLGSFGLANACIRLPPGKRIGNDGKIQLATPDNPGKFDFQMYNHIDAVDYPAGVPVVDARFTYIGPQRYLNSNPHHCVSDIVVPTLLDFVPTQSGVSIETTRFAVHGDASKFCATTIRRLGVVAADTANEVDLTEWRCFREIRLPRRNCYRLPERTWSRSDSYPPAIRAANKWLFSHSATWAWLHRMAQASKKCQPGEAHRNRALLPPEREYALIYDRRDDTSRRRMTNSAEVEAALKAYYGDRLPVVLYHSLEHLSTCEQAELFSNARVAVFPHGGHAPNVMYMPVGSEAIELFCGRPDENGGITSFSYAGLMGLRWTTIHEPSCTSTTFACGAYMHIPSFNATTSNILDTLLEPSGRRR